MNLPFSRSILVATAAVLLAAAPAHAAIEFTTFGLNHTYNNNVFDVVEGSSGSDAAQADEFTASFTGILSSVSVAVGAPGEPSDPLNLYLYQNNPATDFPTTLGAVYLGTFYDTAGVNSIFTLAPASTTIAPLVAGQTYWLGMTAASSSTYALWDFASNLNATIGVYSTNGRASYTSYNAGPSAFEIDAVPEPSTWGLPGLRCGNAGPNATPPRRPRVTGHGVLWSC